MSEKVYINDLPIEVLEMILDLVNGITLGRCRRVCRYWKDVIDGSEKLWYQKCQYKFKNASRIAKRKSGKQCTWYHIYRNLTRWQDLKEFDLETREFCKLNISYKDTHALDIDNGILAVRVDKTTVLYDTTTLENMTVTLPDRNFLKLANNDSVTVLQVKSGIYVQRTAEYSGFVTEGFFNADDFLLTKDHLYLHYNKDFFEIDLKLPDFTLNFVASVEYNIKQMSYNDNVIYLFTDYGYIVSVHMNNPIPKRLKYRLIKYPVEWIKQIKHVRAVDHENFVCYSNNLLLIEVDKYKHLYLEFPPITALFFYVDIILLGTTSGKILLYRLSNQPNNYRRHNIEPIFETLARLPEGKVALQIDVCERRTGPLVVAATYNQLYVIEIPFFPHEPQTTESSFTLDKLKMYKRMQRLKERLKHEINQENHKATDTQAS